MAPRFKYHGRSKEDVNRRAKQSSGRYDSYITESVTWFRPRSGENQIRLLPWLNEADKDFEAYDEKWGNHWGIDIIVHRNVGPDNGTYLCLDKMKGEPCPVCDAWRGEGLDALKGSDRMLCWLIDRNDEKAGPQLWAMPLGVSKDISAVSLDKKSGEMLLIDNWDEGFDVFFDREGEKDRTQYKRVALDRDATPLHDDEDKQNAWLEQVFEKRLPDMLKYYDADYLEKVLSGQVERQEEESNDNRDRGGSSRRRRDSDEPSGDREEASGRGGSRGEGGDSDSRSGRRRLETDDTERAPSSRRRDGSDEGEDEPASTDANERDTRRRGAEDREERTSRRRGEDETPSRDREVEQENEEQEARSTRRRPLRDAEPEPDPKERLRNVGRRRS